MECSCDDYLFCFLLYAFCLCASESFEFESVLLFMNELWNVCVGPIFVKSQTKLLLLLFLHFIYIDTVSHDQKG